MIIFLNSSGNRDHDMTITVQEASVADLETLYQIEQQCFDKEAFSKNQIAWLLKAMNSISFLVKSNGDIAGFVIGLIDTHDKTRVGHIMTIDVAPKYRRKGVGMKLLERIEKEFANHSAKICYLEVRADNVAAKRLYEKLGYGEVEALKDYYYRGGHGIRLKKTLLL
jgi:ribosomal-protein-alanine N-acetyltransferase